MVRLAQRAGAERGRRAGGRGRPWRETVPPGLMSDSRPIRPQRAGLQPERDTRGALSRLVEVLLDKGVYLDLDLIVTVAEVPLIAVDIRAAIAGVETMIEYGLLGPWEGESGSADLPARPASIADEVLLRSDARYREPRSTGSVWREGILTVDRSGAVRWQGRGDRRASLRMSRSAAGAGRLRPSAGPDGLDVLELPSPSGTVELAGAEAARWLALLGDGVGHPGSGADGGRA